MRVTPEVGHTLRGFAAAKSYPCRSGITRQNHCPDTSFSGPVRRSLALAPPAVLYFEFRVIR